MASRDDFEIEEDDDGNKFARMPYDQARDQRDLARQASDNATKAAEGDAAKRELALIKAGVDTDTALGKLFAKSYDGELTADAIKAAAAEIPGLVTPVTDAATTTDGAEQLTPEQVEAARVEAEQTGARQALASGAAAVGVVEVDPIDAAGQAADAVRKRGGTDTTAAVAALNTLVGAAASGDKRVLIDPRTGARMGVSA